MNENSKDQFGWLHDEFCFWVTFFLFIFSQMVDSGSCQKFWFHVLDIHLSVIRDEMGDDTLMKMN